MYMCYLKILLYWFFNNLISILNINANNRQLITVYVHHFRVFVNLPLETHGILFQRPRLASRVRGGA